jgi:hypothetical protein
MTDDELQTISKKKEYKGQINYEGILGGHLNRVASYRDMDTKRYASSVETYALMTPPGICETILEELDRLGLTRCIYDGITPDKLKLYDDLFRFINRTLAAEGLIFKISSYELGIEDR